MTPRFLLALLLTLPSPAAVRPPPRPHLQRLPQLGNPVPASVRKAQTPGRLCVTGERHREPCARVLVQDDEVTIAWDAATHRVTFLYSTTLVTDSDLAAGGVGRIDASMDIQPFLGGFVSPDWCDTDAELSGDALWCAVMKPARRFHGRVLGFVQSTYLPFAPDDPADLPFIQTSTRRHPMAAR